MSSLFDPDGNAAFFATLRSQIGKNGSCTLLMVHTTASALTPNQRLAGICVKGDVGAFLVAEDASVFLMGDYKSFDDMEFCAVDKNPLGLSCGDRFTISSCASASPNLGQTIDSAGMPGGLQLEILDDVRSQSGGERKRRNVLRRVTIGTGAVAKTLNMENSMRAVVAWLDKYNAIHGPKYKMDKLVWCEEGSSARSSGGMVRGWFRIDINDGFKRKVVANASDAIYYMEQIAKTDFHQEMASSPDDFSFDFVEQKATSAKALPTPMIAIM